MKHGLRPAESRFAAEVAAGKSQAEAYRIAFPRSRRWTDKSVHESASRLAHTAKVAARVASLVEHAEARVGMTHEEWIRKWMVVESDSKTLYDRREALKEIGKALGYYKPEKHQSDVAVNVEHRVLPSLDDRIAMIDRILLRAIEDAKRSQGKVIDVVETSQQKDGA